MNGKKRCKALKEIRQQIADSNDIPFVTSNCTHKGECKGTCPKCESELRYLERELERKQNLGRAVAVVGISVGLCTSLTACSAVEAVGEYLSDSFGIGYDDVGGVAEPYDDVAGEMDMVEDY